MKCYFGLVLILISAGCTRSVHEAIAPPRAKQGSLVAAAASTRAGRSSTVTETASNGNPLAEADGARKFFLQERLAAGMTELPAERYAAAREHIAVMPWIRASGAIGGRSGLRSKYDATTSGWTNVGPGNVGGRT